MDNRTIEEVRNNETKLIKEIEILEEENRELKKQLSNSHQMKNQQKEFIEWLEIEIKKKIHLEQNSFILMKMDFVIGI